MQSEIDLTAEIEKLGVELGYAEPYYKAEDTTALPGFSFNLVEVNPAEKE
jgi:hypothetical protein